MLTRVTDERRTIVNQLHTFCSSTSEKGPDCIWGDVPKSPVHSCQVHPLWCHNLLPPEQAAELLPWYMQWSQDLAAEMHQRRLVRNEARHTVTLPISYRPCDCVAEWRCEPHDACFIHDSCFCPGSGSFPSVKPPRS